MAQPTTLLPLTDKQIEQLTELGIDPKLVRQTQTGRNINLFYQLPTRKDRQRSTSSGSQQLEGRDR